MQPTSAEQSPSLPDPAALSHDPDVALESRILRYAQLGARLLGVMFIIDGIAGLAGSIVYMIMYLAAVKRAGYGSSFPDDYACGWFAASFVTFLFGYYLISDGRKLIEVVFMPPAPASKSAETAAADTHTDDSANVR